MQHCVEFDWFCVFRYLLFEQGMRQIPTCGNMWDKYVKIAHFMIVWFILCENVGNMQNFSQIWQKLWGHAGILHVFGHFRAKILCFLPHLLVLYCLGNKGWNSLIGEGVLALGSAINFPIDAGRFWPKSGGPPFFRGFFGVHKCVWKKGTGSLTFVVFFVKTSENW